MKHVKEDVDDAVISSIGGVPNRYDKKEPTRFAAFKKFFIPRLRKQEELALAFEEAAVRKLDAEGEKLSQEAAKIAAEREVTKQEELRRYQENVENTFRPSDSPEVTILKMAKLLQMNPEIADQLAKVNAVLERLARQRQCRVAFKESDESGDA